MYSFTAGMLCSSAILAQPQPSPDALLHGFLASRGSIRTASLTVHVTTHRSRPLGARGHDIEARFVILYKQGKHKIIRTETIPVVKTYKLPPNTEIDAEITSDPEAADKLRRDGVLADVLEQSVSIITPTEGLRYWDNKITLHDPMDLWKWEGFDFRNIGISLSSAEDRGESQLDRNLNPGDNWTLVGRQLIGTDELYEVSRSYRDTVERLWICPNKSFGLTRREVKVGDDWLSYLEAEHELYQGRWFPKRVLRSRESESEVRFTGVITIEQVRFDVEIADSEFSMPSLGAPPGTPVVDHRSHTQVGHWNGTEIVPLSPPETLDTAGDSGHVHGGILEGARVSITTVLWLFSAVGLILAAALWLRQRRQMR